MSPVFITLGEAARRLTVAVPTLRRELVRRNLVVPQRGRLPARLIGDWLAAAYDSAWPKGCCPAYSDEDLRRLCGANVDMMAPLLGYSRTALYQAIAARQIPAVAIGGKAAVIDGVVTMIGSRVVIPADLPHQLERRRHWPDE
jgi:hypothetical protein